MNDDEVIGSLYGTMGYYNPIHQTISDRFGSPYASVEEFPKGGHGAKLVRIFSDSDGHDLPWINPGYYLEIVHDRKGRLGNVEPNGEVINNNGYTCGFLVSSGGQSSPFGIDNFGQTQLPNAQFVDRGDGGMWPVRLLSAHTRMY